jgi:hypothetical protein
MGSANARAVPREQAHHAPARVAERGCGLGGEGGHTRRHSRVSRLAISRERLRLAPLPCFVGGAGFGRPSGCGCERGGDPECRNGDKRVAHSMARAARAWLAVGRAPWP